jgi:hypothetical protein
MPITVKPTQADLAIARSVAQYTNARTEKSGRRCYLGWG